MAAAADEADEAVATDDECGAERRADKEEAAETSALTLETALLVAAGGADETGATEESAMLLEGGAEETMVLEATAEELPAGAASEPVASKIAQVTAAASLMRVMVLLRVLKGRT